MKCHICGKRVWIKSVTPPQCRRHYEAALLMSVLERSGAEPTAENGREALKEMQLLWAIEPDELETLFEEITESHTTVPGD